VFQTVLVFVRYPGPVEEPWFHFNMYTSPAFLAAVCATVNLVLLLLVFRIHTVDDTGKLTINVAEDDDRIEEDDEDEEMGRCMCGTVNRVLPPCTCL
jgi:hypothetical protein